MTLQGFFSERAIFVAACGLVVVSEDIPIPQLTMGIKAQHGLRPSNSSSVTTLRSSSTTCSSILCQSIPAQKARLLVKSLAPCTLCVGDFLTGSKAYMTNSNQMWSEFHPGSFPSSMHLRGRTSTETARAIVRLRRTRLCTGNHQTR